MGSGEMKTTAVVGTGSSPVPADKQQVFKISVLLVVIVFPSVLP